MQWTRATLPLTIMMDSPDEGRGDTGTYPELEPAEIEPAGIELMKIKAANIDAERLA